MWLVGVRGRFFWLRQCGFCCVNCLSKLESSFVIAFKVDDLVHDEKCKDFDEQSFWFFLFCWCWIICCLGWMWWWFLMREYLSNWEFQRNFGIRKCLESMHLGICETRIPLLNSWIVLCNKMKCGVCFLQVHENGIAKGILGCYWSFLSVWCIGGMEVLNAWFNVMWWVRKKKHGQLKWERERYRRDL
jgi:hypothetical protein